MTALAFLFAVFLARPCPFYILDEVEAALDDLNLDRFLALLRRYAGARPVHRDHPPEAHDGGRRLALRRLDGRRRRLQGALAPAARRRATGAVEPGRASPSRAGGDRCRPVPWRATGSDLFVSGRARPAGGRARRAARSAAAGSSGGCARTSRKTRQALASEIQATLFQTLDEHTWERLEEALIMADVGAATTARSSEARAGGERGRAQRRRGALRAADRAARRDRAHGRRTASTCAPSPR